jgi:hypothetical protein
LITHKKGKNKSDKNGALASLMSGTAEKIIPDRNPSQPEKADISIEHARQPGQSLRIENSLMDENGDEVRLERGTHVDVTVTDETTPAKRNSRVCSTHDTHPALSLAGYPPRPARE